MPVSAVQTAILFAFMAVGFACARLGILNPERERGISALLVKVTLPCLIFASMVRPFETELLPRVLSLIGISFALYAVCIGLAIVASRLMGGKPARRGVYRYGMIFSNAGFMGFPVLESLFGAQSVFYAAVYNIAFQVLAFSVGMLILGWNSRRIGRERILRLLVNPNIISALAGLAFFLLRLGLPGPVREAVSRIGDMTTPLSMIFIGSLLSRASYGSLLRDPRIWFVSLFRLLAVPLLAYATLKSLLRDPGFPLHVPVMIAAMPAAANTAILAEECGADAEAASMLVTLSTLISLASIPVLARLLFRV
jgi:hypothetical protein